MTVSCLCMGAAAAMQRRLGERQTKHDAGCTLHLWSKNVTIQSKYKLNFSPQNVFVMKISLHLFDNISLLKWV